MVSHLSPWSVTAAVAAEPVLVSENSGTLELSHLQSQFRAIAEKVSPSVVAISAEVTAPDADEAMQSEAINGDKLETLLDRTTRIVGTGFVIDPDGFILTNEHVIGEAGQIWVTTDDRRVYPAIVIGSDPRADLAVLKVPAQNLPAVRFASSSGIRRGMWTIALGNPYGLAGSGEMSMSVGIVSATDRSLPKLASQENRLYTNLIQTTAEINPGNSGGPLFNLNGEVMGINTAVILPQKQTNGIGFAMPINAELLGKVTDLKAGREVSYAYLGVMVSTPTPRQRRDANISDGGGVTIDLVEKDSPAATVLKVGDLMLKVNDQAVSESDQFVRVIGNVPVDRPTRLSVRREGQPLSLSVQLRRRELPSVAVHRENQRIHWRGMLLGPIPAHWDFGPLKRPEHGLMVLGIDPGSPLVKQGIRSGVVIASVAGKAVNAITDLQSILNDTPAEQCKVEIIPQAKEAVVSGQ